MTPKGKLHSLEGKCASRKCAPDECPDVADGADFAACPVVMYFLHLADMGMHFYILRNLPRLWF
jgi:hypothetical protein